MQQFMVAVVGAVNFHRQIQWYERACLRNLIILNGTAVFKYLSEYLSRGLHN